MGLLRCIHPLEKLDTHSHTVIVPMGEISGREGLSWQYAVPPSWRKTQVMSVFFLYTPMCPILDYFSSDVTSALKSWTATKAFSATGDFLSQCFPKAPKHVRDWASSRATSCPRLGLRFARYHLMHDGTCLRRWSVVLEPHRFHKGTFVHG